jgi:ATP-dependent helicase/nuclease subunit B
MAERDLVLSWDRPLERSHVEGDLAMRLIFGMACDGACYPDYPGQGDGVIDAAIVGPSGLLDALEIELGLTGPSIPRAVRIASYMSKLDACLAVEPDAFFAASFALDAWGTAAQLLEWRDQLVAAGWSGDAVGALRPDCLAVVERLGPRLPPGIADRAHAVCEALRIRSGLELTHLELAEPGEMLPAPWDRVVAAIGKAGTEVSEMKDAPVAGGDLGIVQAFLSRGDGTGLSGDGTFVIVEADTALAAAEATAEWLDHGGAEGLNGTVVVSEDGDTSLLDLALRARSLPALGMSAPSPLRGALQILPLAFAICWAPFDARALLDLLLLPRSPLPPFAARRLASALAREPGRGSVSWSAAWQAIEQDLAERSGDDAGGVRGAAARLASWRNWTDGATHDRSGGMSAEDAVAIASRVAGWALEAGALGDELLMALASAAGAFVRSIEVLGKDRLSYELVGRMVDQVLADGVGDPGHVATAGGLRAVRDPAALLASARNVLWWNCTGPGTGLASMPWNRAEVSALAAGGCRLESMAEHAARVARGYANAVLRAGERLIMVVPALSAGKETVSHPLSHQLRPIVAPTGSAVRWRAENLLHGTAHRFGGRDVIRQAIPIVQPPCQRAHWNLPTSISRRLTDRTESASSFERLVDCQIRWLVLDVLRVGRGSIARLPGTDQLVGNLAHELACLVFPPGPIMEPDMVLARVEELFDGLLLSIAAPLAQPGLAGELSVARARLPVSLAELARKLRAMGVEVVGTEMERSARVADGLDVVGRLDLVVRHPTRGVGIVDLKWTRSARRRRDELANGRSIQLATYGAIAGDAGDSHRPAAFYLLSQRRLIGMAGSFLSEEVVEGGSELDAVWTDVVGTWRHWRDRTRAGTAIASGAKGAAEHISAVIPMAPGSEPCRYCELNALCRVGVETN